MPVFIQDQYAFEKIVLVEGEQYRKYKTIEAFSDCSFDAFYEAWLQQKNDPLVFGVKTEHGNAAIYGLGGWNRYAVRRSGEILFISVQGTPDGVRKAKEAGFNIL